MLISIEANPSSKFDGQDLCDNLEALSEYIRDTRDSDGTYRYGTDAFLGITKLADHITLELQRDEDYSELMKGIWTAEKRAHAESEALSEEVGKAKRMIKKARKEAQSSKMELVAILSIFAALVIAFSGGLTFMGSAISSVSEVPIGTTILSVLVCGLMLFNIIAFLMVMIVVIVRLGRDDDEPLLSRRTAIGLALVITAFDIVLVVAIGVMIAGGTSIL